MLAHGQGGLVHLLENSDVGASQFERLPHLGCKLFPVNTRQNSSSRRQQTPNKIRKFAILFGYCGGYLPWRHLLKLRWCCAVVRITQVRAWTSYSTHVSLSTSSAKALWHETRRPQGQRRRAVMAEKTAIKHTKWRHARIKNEHPATQP